MIYSYILLNYFLIFVFGDELILKINNGFVKGSFATTEKNTSYFSFKGIPYAQPPEGNLRFEPPIPVSSWPNTFDATKDGNVCVQFDIITGKIKGSENCLFINVYTPVAKIFNITKLLPVMVYIYGGAFVTGSSRLEENNPELFLDENVVFVDFNYRLGIFGFISTQDTVMPGNNGLKDQILALKWVRDNIEVFGGDPKKVTIFGQSAGGASVSYLVKSTLAKDLFRAAILQSGVALSPWALSRKGGEIAKKTARLLNVNVNSSKSIVDGLKDVEFGKLALVSSFTSGVEYTKAFLSGLLFAPVIEPNHKDAVLTEKMHEEIKNGKFNRVPLIIGFTSNELATMAAAMVLLRPYLLMYDSQPTKLVPEDMNINLFSDEIAAGSLIKSHYFGLLPISFAPDRFIHFDSDNLFVRPINEMVKQTSKHVPVYYYEFTYEGKLGAYVRTLKGVGHCEELNYLFKNEKKSLKVNENDKIVRKKLVKLWTNFAKYMKPTLKEDEILDNIEWPTTNSDNSSSLLYLDIGYNLKVKRNPHKKDMDFWQKLYERYGNPPYDTY